MTDSAFGVDHGEISKAAKMPKFGAPSAQEKAFRGGYKVGSFARKNKKAIAGGAAVVGGAGAFALSRKDSK